MAVKAVSRARATALVITPWPQWSLAVKYPSSRQSGMRAAGRSSILPRNSPVPSPTIAQSQPPRSQLSAVAATFASAMERS